MLEGVEAIVSDENCFLGEKSKYDVVFLGKAGIMNNDRRCN